MTQTDNSQYLVMTGGEDFATDSRDGCFWDEQGDCLRLLDDQQPRLNPNTRADAVEDWRQAAPLVMDGYGQLGLLSESGTRLLYAVDWRRIGDAQPVLASLDSDTGAEAAALTLDPVDAPPGTRFTDLHLGGDGRAALTYTDDGHRHGLLVVQLARRWQRRCALTDRPHRVWVDRLDRVWVASHAAIMLCSGEPLPQPYVPDPARFEPRVINAGALKQQWRQPLPAGLRILALCADEHDLFMLAEHTDSGEQRLLRRPLDEERQAPIDTIPLPDGLPFATDIAALGRERLALMIRTHRERPDLPVLDIGPEGAARLLPRRYPLHSQARQRFVAGTATGARYFSETGPRGLHPLPQARYRPAGSATINATVDAGEPGTCWHRLYVDACVPAGCTLGVDVKVFDEYHERGDEWHAQHPPQRQPRGSELPFHAAADAPGADADRGLYEVLLQRGSGTVRQLRGRYLRMRIHMSGDGRHSPSLFAARLYFPRLSWQQAYLPEVFHQVEVAGATPGPANGADVRERFLAALEGMLTPLENRIANAECWLYPMGAPTENLPHLARSLGMTLPAHWPLQRRRRWLAAAGRLQQAKGTYAGLCLALDIATDGAVSRGQVVPVENYRLRRTLATILGVDLDDEHHPLTLGTRQSGNSIVGETLVLTDEDAREFLALFAPELAAREGDSEAVAAFFDRYAHRLSVVLHGEARPLRGTVETVLRDFVPAGSQWAFAETEHPFVLGLSPLLGIDSYLERQPEWRQVVLDDVYLGREGILRNPAAFAPGEVTPRGNSL